MGVVGEQGRWSLLSPHSAPAASPWAERDMWPPTLQDFTEQSQVPLPSPSWRRSTCVSPEHSPQGARPGRSGGTGPGAGGETAPLKSQVGVQLQSLDPPPSCLTGDTRPHGPPVSTSAPWPCRPLPCPQGKRRARQTRVSQRGGMWAPLTPLVGSGQQLPLRERWRDVQGPVSS